MVVGVEQLVEIETRLRPELQEGLTGILAKLNRSEKLEYFLRLIGKESLLTGIDKVHHASKSGLIVVLGESQIKENEMNGILKQFGIRRERLKCYLGYDEAKRFSYTSLQYQSKYALVLVGSMGHKAQNMGDHSSAISMMEQEDGYPPVRRLGENELKITKSNFKVAIGEALAAGIITVG